MREVISYLQRDVDYMKLHVELEKTLNLQFIEKFYFNSVSDPPKGDILFFSYL
jgi:hypothetical protein